VNSEWVYWARRSSSNDPGGSDGFYRRVYAQKQIPRSRRFSHDGGLLEVKTQLRGIASAVPLSTLRAQLASQLQTLGSDLDSNCGRGQTL
jgi:hypothetical protein